MSQERFGGSWTRTKLNVLQQYLQAYTTALKNQPFRLWYVDAFAGTGTVHLTSVRDSLQSPRSSNSCKTSIALRRKFRRC